MIKYHMLLANPVLIEVSVAKETEAEALESAKRVFSKILETEEITGLTEAVICDLLDRCSWGSNGYNRIADCNSNFDVMFYWTEE